MHTARAPSSSPAKTYDFREIIEMMKPGEQAEERLPLPFAEQVREIFEGVTPTEPPLSPPALPSEATKPPE